MIGSRRYPCGHGFVRLHDEPAVHVRVCPVCRAEYAVTVELAPYVTGRIGRPVHKVSWARRALTATMSGPVGGPDVDVTPKNGA